MGDPFMHTKTKNEEMILRGIPEKIAQMRIEQAMSKRTHSAHWPVHGRIINFYLANLGFVELIHKSIKSLYSKRWASEKIAPLFRAPTSLFYRWGLFDWKQHMQLAPEERLELADWFVEFIKILKQPPYLSENHQNRLWNDERVKQKIEEVPWIRLETEEEKKLAGNLLGQMFNYTELLYFAYHAHGHEYHGLYKSGDNDYIFADFFRLQSPIYEASKKFPFTEFRVGIQTKDYPFSIDIYQHLFAKEPLPLHIQKIAVVGAGEIKTLYSLRDLIIKLDSAIKEVILEISKKTEEEMIVKFLLSCYVGFGELFHAAQTESEIPWAITLTELKQKYGEAPPPVPPKMVENPDPKELLEYWMRQLSPV